MLSSLHETASLDFYLHAIKDYKSLFLQPAKPRNQTRESITNRASITRNQLTFRNDQEEKSEIRELKKFLATLTATYFAQVQEILGQYLKVGAVKQDNAMLKGFVSMLAYQCSQFDSEA